MKSKNLNIARKIVKATHITHLIFAIGLRPAGQ